MMDKYRNFYELAGQLYPEDEITYSSLSGLVRKKWVTSRMEAMTEGNLLDCGCNIGRLAAFWKKGTAFCIDISHALLVKGKKHFPELIFINGDLRNIEFIRDGSVDNAIVIEVIEHLDKPKEFLKGLYHAMKKKGQVLITCPSYSYFRPQYLDLGIVKSFGVCKGPDENGDRYLHTAYKPAELAALTSQAGFRVVESGSFEHEMRVWNRLLVELLNLSSFLGAKFFPYSRLNCLLLKTIHKLEVNIFQTLDLFWFSRILKMLFKEGRRTYVLAKKD